MKTAKSKSFDLNRNKTDRNETNNIELTRSFDFVNYYKSAEEIHIKPVDKKKENEGVDKENDFVSKVLQKKPKSERSAKKKFKHEPLDISEINVDDALRNSKHKKSPRGDSGVTSTPNIGKSRDTEVKSIMKSFTSNGDDSMDGSHLYDSTSKRKKRNKSVSFLLEDVDTVATKKTKSNDVLVTNARHDKKMSKKDATKLVDNKHKINKKERKTRTESEDIKSTESVDIDQIEDKIVDTRKVKGNFKEKQKSSSENIESSTSDVPSSSSQERKKKFKNKQKVVQEANVQSEKETNNEDEEQVETRDKKKKKKRSKCTETEGEPQIKSRKKEQKPDITEDLENLNIGDNAHTLTNLLDEMTVVDKDKKKKKNKKRVKKDVKQNASGTETDEQTGQDVEKIKWKKRKWNKDRKGEISEDELHTTLIIENLPLELMWTYKTLLSEHFVSFGGLKRIGIAEVYPSEESKPVFTTTIQFDDPETTTKALKEVNTMLGGSRIRVKRPLPPTETTIVIHSYAELTDQSVSSVFAGVGRIRHIKHLVKGKKSIATSFVEFDGPESVEKALKVGKGAKIGGKKIYVSKFERRVQKENSKDRKRKESENEGDSENSND